MAADKSANLSPLIHNLRAKTDLSPYGRELLADLLQRHQLKKLRGGRQSPIYTGPTDDQVRVMAAYIAYVEERRRKGENSADAVTRLAKEYQCHRNQLENYLKNSGGTARRFPKSLLRNPPSKVGRPGRD